MDKIISSTCTWCGEQIEVGQPTSHTFEGKLPHLVCACEADESNDYEGV